MTNVVATLYIGSTAFIMAFAVAPGVGRVDSIGALGNARTHTKKGRGNDGFELAHYAYSLCIVAANSTALSRAVRLDI